MFKRMMGFLADQSGVSGVVVAIALIVVGALGAYWLYSGIKPGVQGTANRMGQVLQQQ